jgi:hypothetical protein
MTSNMPATQPNSTTAVAAATGMAQQQEDEVNDVLLESLPPNVGILSESQLRVAKRDLKHRIHTWEEDFLHRNGHAPLAYDKQPVRNAYDTYKNLKLRLEAIAAERHYQHQHAEASPPMAAPQVVVPITTTSQQHITVPNPPPPLPAASVIQLKEEKHILKRQLHEFEAQIRSQYGRAPTREDRRIMFAQYARYGELKTLLQ